MLTFREFIMRERVPLTAVHEAVLEFLSRVNDAVLFGAQAVNAYVEEPRMTENVDVLSPRARELAEQLTRFLRERLHIAARVREIGQGRGYRVFQVRKPKNRHLVDIRPVTALPPAKRIGGILVVTPEELIAEKVMAYHCRKGHPKSGTDWRDLAMLLLTFPKLKKKDSLVLDRLRAADADEAVVATWHELVAQEIKPPQEDDEF